MGRGPEQTEKYFGRTLTFLIPRAYELHKLKVNCINVIQ